MLSLLDQPQPPERTDVLVALLVKWRGPEELAEVARSKEASPTLRASLAEALARSLARDEVARARVAEALAELARDPDAGVRIAAVEAIGLASLQGDRSIEALLRRAATEDRSESVRSEARALLESAE